MRRKRKKAQHRRILTMVIPVVILILALGAIMVWKVFVVRVVDVVGNEIYSDEQIENWVLDDEYSWNSLYVVLKNKFQKQDEIPFVDAMEISLKSPSKLQIKVIEKGVLGYVYIPTLGKNAYFDKDGFVVEISPDIIEGTMKISGLDITNATLYEKLDLDNAGILRTLLNLSQLLKKYDRIPQVIYVRNSQILLSYGSIQVDVGAGSSLNEKLLRMDQILPQLEGQTGTVHLDTWSQNSTDIYFKQNELTEIPVDEQTVPVGEESYSEEEEQTREIQPSQEGQSAEENQTSQEGQAENDNP